MSNSSLTKCNRICLLLELEHVGDKIFPAITANNEMLIITLGGAYNREINAEILQTDSESNNHHINSNFLRNVHKRYAKELSLKLRQQKLADV